MGYSIGTSGLEKTKKFDLVEGATFYMGASSSPSYVVVTKIEESKVWYVRVYDAEWKDAQPRADQRWIVEDLIRKGCTTMRKQADAYAADAKRNPTKWNLFIAECAERHTHAIGKEYTFEKRYVCNCCGDDCEITDNRSSCCGQDYRENSKPTF